MSNNSANLNRLKLWMIYLVISFVVMLASLESSPNDKDVEDSRDTPTKREANREWCIAASIITFALTAVILGVHFLTNYPIIGGKLEGFSIFLSVVCWCALVIVASQPGSGVAVNSSDGSVSNGNIYYFSWGGFLTSAVLMVSFLQHSVQVYVPNELAATRFKYWATLLASSIVVLGSSADFFGRICDAEGGTAYCDRCILGIIFGSFGTLISIIIVTMNIAIGRVPFMMECGLSLLIFILNAFGVAFLTSDKGPGAPLGNLYYFSWLSFALIFLIISGCYEDYKLAQEGMSPEDLALSQAKTLKRDNKLRTNLEEEGEIEDFEK